MRVAPYRTKAGATAPRGACSSTALALPHLSRRLAVPRIADPYRTLSRSRAFALLAALFACTSSLSSGTACRCMAHRHTVRRSKPHPATSDANCPAASPTAASTSLHRTLRPQPGMWWRRRPLWRRCPRLPEDRLVGQTRQSRRARVGPRGARGRRRRRSGRATAVARPYDCSRRPCRRPPCSARSLSSAHAWTKAGCPSGEPSTTTPRWASGLSPRHTSSPSSAIPGGAGPAFAATTRVLPRLDAMPHRSSTVCTVTSRTALALDGIVTT